MAKRELYIHIGMAKTGTTALQNFFYVNQDTLESYGITYPLNQAWYVAHHHLGWSFNMSHEYRYPNGLKSPDEEWSYVLNLENPRILISSETLFQCVRENIQHIRKMTLGDDVKIVVYLRRQDTMINSLVNQMTKYASHTWTDETDVTCLRRERNYLKIIRSWADVFGKENIIVRPYEKGQFYGGTIFSDFLHYLFGLELTDEFRLPKRDYNPRLHRGALEYKRFINFLSLPIEQKRETIEPLLRFSRRLYAQGRDDFDLLSPSQCLEVIQQYAESNGELAREYLGRTDGKLFYDPLPDPNKPWKPHPGLLPDDIRQISCLIVEQDPKLAKLIGKAIQAGLTSDERDIRAAAEKLKVGLDIRMNWRKISVAYCKGYCMRAIRFIYHKLPAETQPFLKKIADKLKITS